MDTGEAIDADDAGLQAVNHRGAADARDAGADAVESPSVAGKGG